MLMLNSSPAPSRARPRARANPFAGLRCPRCGADESLVIEVAGRTPFLHCATCARPVTVRQIKAHISRWHEVLGRLDRLAE